jgi:hypothetical protein
MKSQNQVNVERARKLSAKKKAAAQAAWGETQEALIAPIEALPASRKPKSFEVNHAVAVARGAFLAALLNGKSLGDCKAAAVAVFPRFV